MREREGVIFISIDNYLYGYSSFFYVNNFNISFSKFTCFLRVEI